MFALTLMVLIVPGLAMTVVAAHEERDPVSFLASTMLLAVAVWLVVPWFVPATPGGLVPLALTTAGVSAAVLLICWRRARRMLAGLEWRSEHWLALAALLLLAVVRFAPLAWFEVAPGADMSMHGYTTRLIAEAGGVPSGYRPLLPLGEFGASAPGLPVLAAIVSTLAAWPAHRGVFFADCLSQFLVGMAFYAFVRQRSSARASVVALLLATMAARDPQAHFEWGGAPTVLSLALAVFGILQIERAHERAWRSSIVPAALALAAAVVAHTVIPFALVFVLPPVALLRFWRAPANERLGVGLRRLLIVALGAVLLMPYLARFHVADRTGPHSRST
jgi:hypothetical protein